MTIKLTMGANITVPNTVLDIKVNCGIDADFSAFRLYSNGKTKNDDDFIFYGQKQSLDGTVKLLSEGKNAHFIVNLTQLPLTVDKVAFSVTLDGHYKISSLQTLSIDVAKNDSVIAHCPVEIESRQEVALILGELYRRNNEWKFRFIDQGFNGGLKPLAVFYGVVIEDPSKNTPTSNNHDIPRTSAVILQKNQKVSLKKEFGDKLSKINIGLGWDPVKHNSSSYFWNKDYNDDDHEIDLDASCIMLDSCKNIADVVWFGKLQSRCRSISHSGDNLTGEGEGDDEIILINLDEIPSKVDMLVFTINSYSGQNFNNIENASVRVLDQNKKELVRFNLSEKGAHTGMIIASMKRQNSDWDFKAHGIIANGSTYRDTLPIIKREL